MDLKSADLPEIENIVIYPDSKALAVNDKVWLWFKNESDFKLVNTVASEMLINKPHQCRGDVLLDHLEFLLEEGQTQLTDDQMARLPGLLYRKIRQKFRDYHVNNGPFSVKDKRGAPIVDDDERHAWLNALFGIQGEKRETMILWLGSRVVPPSITYGRLLEEGAPPDRREFNAAVTELQTIQSGIKHLDETYWTQESKTAYLAGDYKIATQYAKNALELKPDHLPAIIYFSAALLQSSNYDVLARYILANEENEQWDRMDTEKIQDWKSVIQTVDIDAALPDYIIHTVVENYQAFGNDADLQSALVQFMALFIFDTNASRVWREFVVLFSRLKYCQEELIDLAIICSKDDVVDWLSTIALNDSNPDDFGRSREVAIHRLSILAAMRLPSQAKIMRVMEKLLDDENEEIREDALGPFYFWSENGPSRTVKALDDKAPNVRYQALDLLLGNVPRVTVSENLEKKEESDMAPSPLLTEAIITRMFRDRDEDVIELLQEAISERKIAPPKGLFANMLDFFTFKGSSRMGTIGKMLSSLWNSPYFFSRKLSYLKKAKAGYLRGSLESQAIYMEIAANDIDECEREEAIGELVENAHGIPSQFLRRLYEDEGVFDVKKEIEDLIVEKGDLSFCDVYLKSFKRKLAGNHDIEKTFGRLLDAKDLTCISQAIVFAIEKEAYFKLLGFVHILLQLGCKDSTRDIVLSCLAKKDNDPQVILAAALVDDIPTAKLMPYLSHSDLQVKVSALRALAYRKALDDGPAQFAAIYEDLKPKIDAADGDAHWLALDVADGILECAGRDEGIKVLLEIYDALGNHHVFPKRAAWDRLQALGVETVSSRFKDIEPGIPSSWPDKTGPFFGIKK